MNRENLTLSFLDATASGRLDQGDAFVLGGVQTGPRYTLSLLYVPASRILASANLQP